MAVYLGSNQVAGGTLQQKVLLYESEDRGSLGTIELSDDVSNYKYIEIFFQSNDYISNSTKIYNPNYKNVLLYDATPQGSGNLYQKFKIMYIEGTNIIPANYTEAMTQADGTTLLYQTDTIYIYRVVGYKE